MTTNKTKEAIDILDANWAVSVTRFPNHHQPFNSLGNAQISIDRVIEEFTNLYKGQWKNGMLPHMVLENSSGQYAKEKEFWKCDQSPNAPGNVLTSGITQPPTHGFILWKIFQEHRDDEKFVRFLKEIYPKLLMMHEYLYNERNQDGNGLITIRHPWESGMDNSPFWDKLLDGESHLALLDLFKSSAYDDSLINEQCPFQIADPLFNSALVWSNECLLELGIELDLPTNDLFENNENTIHSMNELLWDDEIGCFAAYDAIAKQKIASITHACFMPLIAGIPDIDQVLQMVKVLFGSQFRQHNHYSVPSNNLESATMDHTKFWRGPVWMSTNWLLIQGLKRYDMDDLAKIITKDSIDLIEKFGFYECFDARKEHDSNGHGADQYSGSAAIYLDLIRQ